MKRYAAHLFIFTLSLAACTGGTEPAGKQEETTIAKNVAAGVLIAADSMRVAEETLNEFYFGVRLLTTEYTAQYGTYKVVARWGHNQATSDFSMPRGGEQLKPVLRKAKEPYTYDIGFYQEDDPTFYDYYRISGESGDIQMKYSKAYSFQ